MIGTIGPAGIPVSAADKTGPEKPAINPKTGPQIKPASSTGMCMGKIIGPAPGMAWNAIGNNTHMDISMAVITTFLR